MIPRSRPVRAAVGRICLFGLAGLWGCKEESLDSAADSEKALVAAVLAALADRDQGTLQGFLVSRKEYETLLWPEMPDGKYTPFGFVWGLNEVNSRKGLNEFLNEFGGVRLELVSIELPENSERYESFSLHQDVRVTARRTDSGEEGILPWLDVFVEHESGWKLLNYSEG